MSLLPSTVLLGGVRVGSSNASTTFTPSRRVNNQSTLDQLPDSEISAWVTGVNPSDNFGLLVDTSIKFYVSINRPGINRFGYSDSDRRWNSLPGGPPLNLGPMNNSNRLNVGTVLESYLSESPVLLTCGVIPSFTFDISFVNDNSSFTELPPGFAQISRETGDLNFSSLDLNNPTYSQLDVFWFSQFCNSFTELNSQTIPVRSIENEVSLRPIPSQGWVPRVSFGNRTDLTLVNGPPGPGQIQYEGNGKFRLSPVDLVTYKNDVLVYRGLVQGPRSLAISLLGNSTALWPNVAITDTRFIGVTDPGKYLIAMKSGSNYFYLQSVLVSEDPTFIPSNSPNAYINTSNGKVFIRKRFGSGPLTVVDCELDTGYGASFLLAPSILNIGKIATYSDVSQWITRTEYAVSDNIRGNRISLQDSVNESYPYDFVLANGASSGRTGRLLNLESTVSTGYGYVLDSINKSMQLGVRSNESYSVSGSSIKLNHNAYFDTNLFLTDENGKEIDEDSFELDTNAGLLTFTQSYGRGRNRITSVVNTVLNGVITINDSSLTGQNPGYCSIDGSFFKIKNQSGNKITVVGLLADGSNKNIELYTNLYEAANDSINYNVIPPTNFHLYKSDSMSGPFVELSTNEYSVLEGNGQIRLSSSSEPDTFYRVTYETLVDEKFETRTEYLNATVTNEQCSPTDSPLVWTFNPDRRTLGSPAILNVVVKGTELPPNDYRVDGNTLYLPSDPKSQSVLISYNVLNYEGGKRTFQASSNNILLNSPKFTSGVSIVEFPGDYTADISLNNILVFDDKSCWLVKDVKFDSRSNKTAVRINNALDTNKNNSVAVLNASNPAYLKSVNAIISVAVKTSSILLPGLIDVRRHSLLYISDDPYLVTSVEYQSNSNRTKISLYTSTVRNYSKSSIKYTSLPVIMDSEVTLDNQPAPATSIEVFYVNGNSGEEIPSNKFTLSGNSIQLDYQVGHGTLLVSMETPIVPSIKSVNLVASRQILPDSVNRISGQRLLGSYKIESPDSFYLRTYTYTSFAPEINGLAAGGRINGNGNPSITFQLNSLELADLVLNAFVKYFNDFVNGYESLRENFLGTPIGGSNYKFRYDGFFNNPKRDEYWQVTNHIDDDIYIRTQRRRLLFIVRRTKIYSKMYEYNRFSRLFKNAADVIVQVSAETNVPGSVIGTTGYTNVTSNTSAKIVPSQARIKSRNDYNSFTVYNGDPNKDMPPIAVGQPVNYYNRLHENVGSLSVTAINVIDPDTGLSSVTTTGGESISMEYNAGFLLSPASSVEYVTFRVDPESGDIITNGRQEFMSQVLFPEIPPNSYIRLGITYSPTNTSINESPFLLGGIYKDDGTYDDGSYLYPHEYDLLSKESFLISAENETRFGKANALLVDRVFVDLPGVYVGSKIYFLDGPNQGKTVTLKTAVTIDTFITEESILNVGGGLVDVYSSGDDTIPDVVAQYRNAIYSSIPLAVGSVIYFTSGPNANVRLTITNTVSGVYLVNKNITVDLSPRTVKRDAVGINIPNLFTDYYNIYVNNSSSNATSSNKYGSNASILKLVRTISESIGPEFKSGAFVVDGTNCEILGSPYEVPENSYLVVTDGDNQGLYSIKSNTEDGFILLDNGFFTGFPLGGIVQGTIFTMYGFLDPASVEPIAKIWRETYRFWLETNVFYADPSPSAFPARRESLSNRMSSIEAYWTILLDTLLSSTNTYEVRQTWITQRADKVSGIVAKKSQEQVNISKKLLTLRQDLLRQLVLSGL